MRRCDRPSTATSSRRWPTAAIGLLSPDAVGGIAAELFQVTAARYGRIPPTYVVCTRDNAVAPLLQRRIIGEIDAVSAGPTAVVELTSSPSPMLSQPGALAAVIAAVC